MQYAPAIHAAKKLSAVQTIEDIHQLSNAVFPGTHCPLFGALLVASYIKDLAVLNIGTEECTFYGKDFSRLRQKGKDLVFSLVTHKNDITFGLEKKVTQAVDTLYAAHRPKAILLISTCVVELIGEDISALSITLTERLGIPVLFVKTEHFKCNSHIPGLTDTMAALVKIMPKTEKIPQTVNLLGHRFDGFFETELAKRLRDKGIAVHMSIPSACDVDQLKRAGEASLNIVTDFTALSLAKAMKEKLGQPYVVFEKVVHPNRILENYNVLYDALGLERDPEVERQYHHCLTEMASMYKRLEGKTFVYGNAPVKALECSDFLAAIGMTPLWVQMRECYEDDAIYTEALLKKGHDPQISRIANIIPMRTVYDMMKPDFYIGHENPMELMKRNIIQLTFDKEAGGLGFQLPLAILEKISIALNEKGGKRP